MLLGYSRVPYAAALVCIRIIVQFLALIAAGLCVYLLRARARREWPFGGGGPAKELTAETRGHG